MLENKTEVIKLLNTAKGQIDGIIKMINDNKYCIDVSNQILASIAILKKVNVEILDNHLHHCVLNATGQTKLERVEEISQLIKKVMK